MKNRYVGFCTKCRRKVQPGQGQTIKRQGAWFVTHDSCLELADDLEQRANMARNDDDRFAYLAEDRDTSQMNLKFERTDHGRP